VVFVASETADTVMKKYRAAWRDKVSIVPHGYDPVAIAAHDRRPGALRLVHTGRFYSGIRTPDALLKGIAALNARTALSGTLELTFVGPHTDEFRRESAALGLDAIVRFRDRVPPAEASAIAGDADVLLVIDAPSDGPSMFLPSKLIDYLPLRKPILGITPPVGASASLLRRLGCRVVSPTDVDAIAEAVSALVGDWRGGRLVVSPQFDRVAADYDIRRTTAQLSGALGRAFDR
jgi:glycosyltransferase involved in cell wall biosynthesis